MHMCPYLLFFFLVAALAVYMCVCAMQLIRFSERESAREESFGQRAQKRNAIEWRLLLQCN